MEDRKKTVISDPELFHVHTFRCRHAVKGTRYQSVRHCIRLFQNHGMRRFKLRDLNVYLNWLFSGYAYNNISHITEAYIN
jgi:hypothetical protein